MKFKIEISLIDEEIDTEEVLYMQMVSAVDIASIAALVNATAAAHAAVVSEK